MSNTISQVRSIAQAARPFLWEIIIPVPDGVEDGWQGEGDTNLADGILTARARGVQMPGSNMLTTVSYFKGIGTKRPLRREFSRTCVVNFEEGIGGTIYKLVHKWQSAIHDVIEGGGSLDTDLLAPITINMLNYNDEIMYSVKLFEAFPEAIPDQAFRYDDQNFVNLDVTFGYSYTDLEE